MARRAKQSKNDSEDFERQIEAFLALLEDVEEQEEGMDDSQETRTIEATDRRITYFKEGNVCHIFQVGKRVGKRASFVKDAA